MRRFAEKANDTKAVFIDGDFRHTIPDVMQLAYDAVIYCDPTSRPAKPPTSPPTASRLPWTITATWLQPCSMLIASTAPAVISNSDTPETREIYSAFNLHAFSVRRSVSAKSRDMAGEVIGVLRVCDAVAVLAAVIARIAARDGKFHLRRNGCGGAFDGAEGF
jgi:DNA adenine methylase